MLGTTNPNQCLSCFCFLTRSTNDRNQIDNLNRYLTRQNGWRGKRAHEQEPTTDSTRLKSPAWTFVIDSSECDTRMLSSALHFQRILRTRLDHFQRSSLTINAAVCMSSDIFVSRRAFCFASIYSMILTRDHSLIINACASVYFYIGTACFVENSKENIILSKKKNIILCVCLLHKANVGFVDGGCVDMLLHADKPEHFSIFPLKSTLTKHRTRHRMTTAAHLFLSL